MMGVLWLRRSVAAAVVPLKNDARSRFFTRSFSQPLSRKAVVLIKIWMSGDQF